MSGPPTTKRLSKAERRQRLSDATIPLRKLIPNLFTTAALCAGLASLHFIDKGEFDKAIAAIGMSALLDALDGRAARLLRVTSRFGEVFDSISDFVGFCIAPAFLLLRWCRPELSMAGINLEGLLVVAVVLYGVCGAMRLARFTRMQRKKKPGTKPSEFFTGMPTPAAAGAALIPPMILLSSVHARVPTILVIALLLTLAGLMISRVPMFSFKRIRVSRRWAWPLMLLMAITVAGFVRDPWLTGSVISAAYLLSLPLSLRASGRQPKLSDEGNGGEAGSAPVATP